MSGGRSEFPFVFYSEELAEEDPFGKGSLSFLRGGFLFFGHIFLPHRSWLGSIGFGARDTRQGVGANQVG